MKILLDANLSWRLVKLLEGYCEHMVHADKIGLSPPAKDIEIWNYAKANGLLIATNNEDFLHLLMAKGYPPKLVLFRTDNQTTQVMASLFEKHKNEITQLYQNNSLGVLDLF